MSTSLVPTDNQRLVPLFSIKDAVDRYNEVVAFVKTVMKPGIDYGVVPGTDKPTLLKPGGEKLSTFFGLSPRFTEVLTVEDWTGDTHRGEPFFYYKHKCELYRGEHFVAECTGSCNSWEERYRYRKGNRVCPECGKTGTIIRGKPEYGGGWLCFAKKDGCGFKFLIDDKRITEQDTDKVHNERIFDQVNTIVKQSQKRAFVGAVLIGVNASEFFTQDMEDLVLEGDYTVTGEQPKQQKTPAQTPTKNAEIKQTVATAWEPPEEPPFDDGSPGELVQQPATLIAQAPVQVPQQPAEFVEGVLTYRLNGQIKEVLVSRKTPDGVVTVWKQADKQITLSSESLKYYSMLFDHPKHMENYLKKHFPGNASLKTLTWEELAAVYAAKVEDKHDKRWYPDEGASESKASPFMAQAVTLKLLPFLERVKADLKLPDDLESNDDLKNLLLAFFQSIEAGAYAPSTDMEQMVLDFSEAWKDLQKNG